MKYFAGLDVSLDETAICVVDEDGIVVTEGKAASEPDDLVRWLVATGLTITRVGLEAGSKPSKPGSFRSTSVARSHARYFDRCTIHSRRSSA